jgi:hypothetical protein
MVPPAGGEFCSFRFHMTAKTLPFSAIPQVTDPVHFSQPRIISMQIVRKILPSPCSLYPPLSSRFTFPFNLSIHFRLPFLPAASLTARSMSSAALSRVCSSGPRRALRVSAKSRILCALASCNNLSPWAVAVTRIRRASFASASILANRERFSPATMRLMVGALTCSAAASCPSAMGPPNTRTESAESCAGPMRARTSCLRAWRSRWIAAECRRSATSHRNVSFERGTPNSLALRTVSMANIFLDKSGLPSIIR